MLFSLTVSNAIFQNMHQNPLMETRLLADWSRLKGRYPSFCTDTELYNMFTPCCMFMVFVYTAKGRLTSAMDLAASTACEALTFSLLTCPLSNPTVFIYSAVRLI